MKVTPEALRGGAMFRVFNCLTAEHDLRLVVLAGLVCLLSSLVAISLFRRALDTTGRVRAGWIAIAGAATGCGIWATHFIAMLAYEPGVPTAYSIGLTLFSLVLAAAITSLGFANAIYGWTRWPIPASGAIIGGGVAAMHYTGMWALEIPGHVTWVPWLVLASVLFGMLLGGAAMMMAARREQRWAGLYSGLLLTLAIVSHHFTAMGAVDILPDPARQIEELSMSPAALSIAIAAAAVAILGMCFAGAIADGRMQQRDIQLITAVNNMSHGLVMFDPQERIVVCNNRYVEMYGLSRDVVVPGLSFHELMCLRKSTGTLQRDPDEYRTAMLAAVAEGKTTRWVVDAPDGRAIANTNTPIRGGWIATHEDITERRRAEEHITYLAHHDGLTGLPNRLAFNQHIKQVLEHAQKQKGEFAVLCLDLDRFKEVNDVFGHATGDSLLREFSNRLKACCEGAFLARLGGDEFVAIVSEGDQPQRAEALGERLLAAVADDMDIEEHKLRIGLSIGVAIYPHDGTDSTALIGNADAALYRAKEDGRGMLRFFEADMDKRLRERRSLQHDLRSAIEHGQLALHYQPQAQVGGAVMGFEALVRWHHPELGVVAPNVFIPLAEESGLIIAIGEWVLREACREAASWRNPLTISVNLSPVQFRHGDIVATVHGILLETGLKPARLELEITEGVLMADFSRAVAVLRQIKAMGVHIAMDDFGTGYSSLSYLQAFPFDQIKIDRAFIANLESNSQSGTIVRAVLGLARGLDLPVVAEGVETQSQLDFLAGEACERVQGYLVGRPKPISEYADLVRQEPGATVPETRIMPIKAANAA